MPLQARRAGSRASVALLFVCMTACCTTDEGFEPDTTAARHVQEQVASYLEVECDLATDRAALEQYRAAIKNAGTRAAVESAWDAIAALEAKGNLIKSAIDDAKAEGSWPATAALEEVYAAGVRKAVDGFLKGEG